MNEQKITINKTKLPIKEYRGQRVVTLKEIDQVHERPEGTARRNFNTHVGKEHLKEEIDFFRVCADEIRTLKIMDLSPKAHEDITLITETGYLMLVKSFEDDLAWTVQRQLVNTYFRATSEQRREAAQQTELDLKKLTPELRQMINMELRLQEQGKALEETNRRIDGIRDTVALSPTSWRPDCRRQIAKIAQAMGGNEYIRDVNAEVYRLVDERAGVSLATRLTNKRRRMADEGVCKSKRDKLTKVDVIADDRKLIEIYIAIIKDLSIKRGVEWSMPKAGNDRGTADLL